MNQQDISSDAIPAKTTEVNIIATTKRQMPGEASDLEEGQVDENKSIQDVSSILTNKDTTEKQTQQQTINKKDPKVIVLRTRERQVATKLIHKLVVKTTVSSEDESNQSKDTKSNDKPSISELATSKDDAGSSKESTKLKPEDEEGQVLSLDQYIQKNKTSQQVPQLDGKQRSAPKYSSTNRFNITLSDINSENSNINGLRQLQQPFKGNMLSKQFNYQQQFNMDQQQARGNTQNPSGKEQYYYGAPQLKGGQSQEDNSTNDISDSQSLKMQKQFQSMNKQDSQQNQQYYMNQGNSRQDRQVNDSRMDIQESQDVIMQNQEQSIDINTSIEMPLMEQENQSLKQLIQLPIPPPPPPQGIDISQANRRDSLNLSDQKYKLTNQWQNKDYSSQKSFQSQNNSYQNGYKKRTFNTNSNDRSNMQPQRPRDYQNRPYVNRNSNNDVREQRDQRNYYHQQSSNGDYNRQNYAQEDKEQDNSFRGSYAQPQREHSREGKREIQYKVNSPIHVPEMHDKIEVRQSTKHIDIQEDDLLENQFRVRPTNCVNTKDNSKNDISPQSPSTSDQVQDGVVQKQTESTLETNDVDSLKLAKQNQDQNFKSSLDKDGQQEEKKIQDDIVHDMQGQEQEPIKQSKDQNDKAKLHRQIHKRLQEVKRRSQRQNQHKYHIIYRFHSLHCTENDSDEKLKNMDFEVFSRYFRSKLERSSSSSLEREFCINIESKDITTEKQRIDRSRSREKKQSRLTTNLNIQKDTKINNSDTKREQQTPTKVADILRDVQEYHSDDELENSKHISGSNANTVAKASSIPQQRARLDRQLTENLKINPRDKDSKYEEDNQIDYDFDP